MPSHVAVVDIGSNSVRLVVYDGPGRFPLPLYDTKVTARLGHGLTETGRLDPAGVTLALHGLARFRRLIEALGAEPTLALATAAVRAADDGPQFAAAAERALGRPVRVIDGAEEARLSALGVVGTLGDTDGVVADLGGGSLELAAVRNGRLGATASLPLGVLTLIDAVGTDLRAARRMVDMLLEPVEWLHDLAGRRLHLVGGSWRALARVHMETTLYPLPIVQGLTLPAAVVREVARRLSLFDTWPPARLPGLSQRRSETVPHAALVLRRLLVHAKPNAVLFSAHGLREGALLDLLPADELAADPLLAGCARLAPEDGVRADLADALLAWTDPLFPVETVRGRALRRAACRLVDVAWAEHPARRAEQALRRVLDAQALSVPHEERAYLALTTLHRYGGSRRTPGAATALTLAGEDLDARARVLGLALRVAGKLTARSPALLAATGLRIADGRLALSGVEAGPLDEAVVVRLRDLARAAGLGVVPLRYDVA